jgi:hypothetical protein
MKPSRLFALLLTLATIGCASAPSADGERAGSRNRNVLTVEEMRESHHTNVYEAVAALRANWIRQQGQISFQSPTAGQVLVFQDGMRVGDVSYLRQVSVNTVQRLQYFNATEAAARFGLQTDAGPAILITTGTGPRG